MEFARNNISFFACQTLDGSNSMTLEMVLLITAIAFALAPQGCFLNVLRRMRKNVH